MLERDLQPLEAALDGALAGRGQTLIVGGPAGSGVSSVLAAAGRLAQARGIAVVDVRTNPVLPTDAPALVLVDDVQWAAPESLQALIELRPALERLPYCVVLGHHPGPGRFDALAAHLLDDLGAQRLVTAPLSAQAVGRLALLALDDDALPESFSVALHATTAGNPWLVRAALEALTRRGLAPIARSVAALEAAPPEVVSRRARRLLAERSADVTALAEALAVFDGPLTLAQAARLARLDPDAAAVAADELAAAGLIAPGEPLAFLQPLVAAAVGTTMPAFGAAALHARAIGLLREAGAPPERLGRHLLHQPLAGDARAVAALRAAAAGAPRDEAVALLRHALAEPPAPALAPTVLAELALAEAAALTPGAVDRLRAALVTAPDAAWRGRLEIALARTLLAAGEHLAAATEAEAILVTLEPDDPRAEQLLVVQLMVMAVDRTIHEPVVARIGPLMAAAAAGELPDDPGLCAWMAGAMSGLGADPDVVEQLLQRALRENPLIDDDYPMIWSFVQAALCNIGDYARAEAASDAAMARAREHGLDVAHMLAQHGRAIARWRMGRIEDALPDALASLPTPDGPWHAHAPYAAWVLSALHTEQGRFPEAHAALALGRAEFRGPLEESYIENATATLALAEGDAAAALTAATAAGAAMVAFSPHLTPSCLEWQSTLARAALAAGDRELAVEQANGELTRAEVHGLTGWIGRARRVLALTTEGPERVALLRQAVDELEHSQLGGEHAHALADLGVALRDAGDPIAAREPLAAALDIADRTGMTALVARAREELRLSGARPRRAALRGVAALTASELRIAERASLGETNTEIARELFVSVKTVEGTLARAYRKLEISSRTELPAALAP
jgi:DNA-binding CsgD family transcriptional regulator